MRIKTPVVCSILVVLFHTVGLIGFLSPALTPLFLRLIPFHLLLMFALLVISQVEKNKHFGLFVLISCIAGFAVEVLGVSTGVIFGQYEYETALGFKVAEVPPIIGLNWFVLTYSTGILVQNFNIKSNVLKSIMGAVFLVILDILLEPVAVNYNYWEWSSAVIPVRNYVAWFVVSFVLLLIFYKLRFSKQNIAGSVLFITQLLFFAALNLWAF